MKVCIFGDSITWGANDVEKGGWAERLKTFYMAEDEIVIYNLGVRGDKTEDIVKRFDIEAVGCNAGAVIFAVGINDSQYINHKDNTRVSLEQFKNNFELLLAKAQQITNKVLVVGLTRVDESKTMPVPWAHTKYYDNEVIELYDSDLKTFCEEKYVPYLDMHDLIATSEMTDGLHPDALGHKKMFERIRPELEKLVS